MASFVPKVALEPSHVCPRSEPKRRPLQARNITVFSSHIFPGLQSCLSFLHEIEKSEHVPSMRDKTN